MRILKEADGTLIIPVRAENRNGDIGDALLRVSPGEASYGEYLGLYNNEMERLGPVPQSLDYI